MAMTPGEIERKVRQLDHDVQSIYEMLATLTAQQARQGNLLTGMDARLDRIEATLATHDARFDTLEGRFDTLEGKLDELVRLVQRPS